MIKRVDDPNDPNDATRRMIKNAVKEVFGGLPELPEEQKERIKSIYRDAHNIAKSDPKEAIERLFDGIVEVANKHLPKAHTLTADEKIDMRTRMQGILETPLPQFAEHMYSTLIQQCIRDWGKSPGKGTGI